MLLLFAAMALRAAVTLPETSAVDGRYGTVCHHSCADCGSAEARHMARAAQWQLSLCDAHRRRSSSPWLLKWSCRHAVVRRDVAMSAGI